MIGVDMAQETSQGRPAVRVVAEEVDYTKDTVSLGLQIRTVETMY